MKTIVFLGGSPSQVAVLKRAKELGHYIVLCDYLPDNPGAKYANEFHQVSTTDPEKIEAVARTVEADAVVAYASDPAALTAARVSRALGLPGNPVEAVDILTHKDKYRAFLKEHGFHTPEVGGTRYPLVVKPTDMSGSKGVTIVKTPSELNKAIDKAKSFSRSGDIIVEEFVGRKGYQIAGDGFVVDGRLVFRCFANEHFDEGGIVPVGESFPSVLALWMQQNIHNEVQRLLDAVGLKNGALNFDIMLDKDDRIFLMEVGPRAGGCRIPEVIKLAAGFDETEAVIDAALGVSSAGIKTQNVVGFWSSYMIHSLKAGLLEGIAFSEELYGNILEHEMFIEEGDEVHAYEHSGCTIGTMLLKFGSEEEMLHKMDRMAADHVKVLLK